MKLKEKPVSPVIIPRTAVFDPYRKRPRHPKMVLYRIKYSDIISVEVRRPENTVIHEKLFYTIIKISRRQDLYYSNEKWSNLFISDFYEIKKTSGIDPKTSFSAFMNYIKDLSFIRISFYQNNSKVLYLSSLISSAKVLKTYKSKNGKEGYIVGFQIDDEVISLIENSVKFYLDEELLKRINNVKSPYVYKVLMFFATQIKPQQHEVCSLIERITGRKYSKYQKSRIKKEILENRKILLEHNIDTYPSKNKKLIVKLIKPFGKVRR